MSDIIDASTMTREEVLESIRRHSEHIAESTHRYTPHRVMCEGEWITPLEFHKRFENPPFNNY